MEFFLTFDCEDFINIQSIYALKRSLELLQFYHLRAIFFLTGHMCERLTEYPRILDLLENNEIGYHSSAHSVHPTIFEYTDVDDYEEAVDISLERETSRINPLTGEIEGEGGLLTLKDIFPNKGIVTYRAPGFCWSPPNLDALEKLGIRFDFSNSLSNVPIHYKNLTFYPPPVIGTPVLYSRLLPVGRLSVSETASLFERLITRGPIVSIIHPHDFVDEEDWDADYLLGNPRQLRLARTKSSQEMESIFMNFELFLRRISLLVNEEVLEVTPQLRRGIDKTCFKKAEVIRNYRRSSRWPTGYFHYTPQFMLKHFLEYFEIE
jgi:hypothetical protein